MIRRGFSYYAKTLQDLQLVSTATRKFALSLHFSNADAEKITTSVVEIAQYNLRTSPRVLIQAGSINLGRTLKIIIDNEKGISSWLRQSLQAGKSSLYLPELGISRAPRFMDELRILAPSAKGATFVLKKHLPLPGTVFQYATQSLAHQHNPTNGDSFLIREYEGDKVLVALIDGEGHGTPAAVLSNLVKDYLEKNVSLPLLRLVNECHQLLRARPVGGGVVLNLLRLTPGKVFYLGIGDTHAYVQQTDFQKLTHYGGKVGDYDLPVMEVKTLSTQVGSRFILCTDGIKEQIKAADAVRDFSTQRVAENVISNYRRVSGDATVLVLDYTPFAP